RTVILERATDEAHPVRQQRRSQRVAGMPIIAAAVEREGEGPGPFNKAACRQAARLPATGAHTLNHGAPVDLKERGARSWRMRGLRPMRRRRLIAHGLSVGFG